MIYIIADDLTGANDSGVQLSKQGLKTLVYIDHLDWNNYEIAELLVNKDVLVIDTETRELSEDQAGIYIKKLLGKFNLENKDSTIFYKKIDSTLRGNIGREIEEILKLLKKDVCILTPSFPHNKRITVGGYLIVNNQPLGTSQYFNNRYQPWEGTYIPHFIQQQTSLPVGLIELKEIMQGEEVILEQLERQYQSGKRIIIVDAVTEDHLKEIMSSTKKFKGSTLYCGSAGLANYLGNFNIQKPRGENTVFNSNKPVLMVIGTRNKIMEKQIKYLRDKMEVSYLKLDIKEIFANKQNILKKYIKSSLEALKDNKHLILHPDPAYNKAERASEILEKEKISFRELELILRDFIAVLTFNIIQTTRINNLIITGGDTAIGVCKVLGINSLNMLDEVLPGISLSSVNNDKYGDIRLITKAGGFGEEDTLYQLVTKLMKHNKTEVKGLAINRKQNG